MGYFTALKRIIAATTTLLVATRRLSARSTLPVTVPRRRRASKSKTFRNRSLYFTCCIITFLVLRGTISISYISTSSNTSQAQNKDPIGQTDFIVAAIRSGDDDDPSESLANAKTTSSLGPKIRNWDSMRKTWLHHNPGFPSYVNGKPRVLLATGSSPDPCENPIGDHYLLKSRKNKIDYCRIHNIEIVYSTAHLDNELSGYWAKLPLIRTIMLSYPEVEWIWWMDSDAVFTDMAFEIPFSKYDSYNMVVHGYPNLLFYEKSWIALNTGSFLIRNSQWSLDLLDAWAPMGPKGPIRDEAGKVLTANLKGRPAFEADDQSALIYLLISRKDEWIDKVFIENSYFLHGYWAGLVDHYEEMIEKYHPGLGDERWPFITHFVGCKPCGSYGDYPVERCLKSIERAFNFADDQVLKLYGFRHIGLLSSKIKWIRHET